MNRESGSEQTQRTVAELLAQYGGSSGDSAPRRRRRRAEEDHSDTAPQKIIDRVLSDSGRLMRIRDESGVEPEAPPRAAPPPVAPRVKPARPQRPPAAAPSRYAVDEDEAERTAYQPPIRPEPRRPVPPAVDPAEETRQVPPIIDDFPPEPSRSNLPKPAPSRSTVVRPTPHPVVGPAAPNPLPPGPLIKPKPPKPVTEVLPRINDKRTSEATQLHEPVALPGDHPATPGEQTGENWFGQDGDYPEQERTQAHPGPYVDDDEDDYVDDYDVDEEPAGLADGDDVELEDDESRSPAKEWLVMIGQLAAGVLGGAGLWLAFNFLWRSVPAAALVVALAVTVGLVLLVRKIRRADDLQTTVLAVLVGLIVTVSPAAMLLVKH
jgi:hypothetical protein